MLLVHVFLVLTQIVSVVYWNTSTSLLIYCSTNSPSRRALYFYVKNGCSMYMNIGSLQLKHICDIGFCLPPFANNSASLSYLCVDCFEVQLRTCMHIFKYTWTVAKQAIFCFIRAAFNTCRNACHKNLKRYSCWTEANTFKTWPFGFLG